MRTLRPVYEQTAGLADLRRDTEGRAYFEIRSRFFRAVNRRFNAAQAREGFRPHDPAVSAGAGGSGYRVSGAQAPPRLGCW